MKNRFKILIYILALALGISACLASCSDGEVTGGLLPDDDFVPAVDNGAESELFKKYERYRRELPMAFVVFETYSPVSDFIFEETDNGWVISKYVGEDSILVLPPEKDGEHVVGIKAGAFDGKKLRAIYVTNGIDEVEKGAFRGVNGLVTLRLPEIYGGYLGYIFGGDEYGENATTVPSSLDKLIIGDGDTTVEDNAFSGCKSLSGIRFVGEGLEIGEFAFYGCEDLIYVDLLTVSRVGTYAFGECSSLYALDCSSALTVEKGAFYGCKSLNRITLSRLSDGSNDYLGYLFGADSIDHSAEYVPESLRTVEIAGPCKTIGAKAFANCKYITSVVLHEGIEKVDVRAFYGCRSLQKIAFPDTCESIGDDAFFGCDNLKSVTFGRRMESIGMQAFMGCKSLTEVTMPDRLEEIKPMTFYGCTGLTQVNLANVKKIGKHAFKGCDNLSPAVIDGIEIAPGNDALK